MAFTHGNIFADMFARPTHHVLQEIWNHNIVHELLRRDGKHEVCFARLTDVRRDVMSSIKLSAEGMVYKVWLCHCFGAS